MVIKAKNIDEYIALYPIQTQILLQQIRSIIHKAAPKAIEVMSYGMPAFKGDSVLVYFAAYSKHIGFYPTSLPIIKFASELKKYKHSKGAIQLPLDKPIPATLVTKIVAFRVKNDVDNFLLKKPHSNKTNSNIFTILSAPARRALEKAGIKNPQQLAKKTEFEILLLHGIGPSSIPKLKEILAEQKLSFSLK